LADKWIVLKFGGTSVADRPRWETIASLARARQEEGFRVLLVCSAVAGVTDQLSALAEQPGSPSLADELLARHDTLAGELGVPADLWRAEAERRLFGCLESLQKDKSPRRQAELLSLGEHFSTVIGAAFLGQEMACEWVNARDAIQIVAEPGLSKARRWLSASCSAGPDHGLAERWSKRAPVLITQGFVAGDGSGAAALLGRGGSDTSAAIFAGRLSADRLEIWTDVPGLFSADPRRVPEARLLAAIDYTEALEMAASGAGVVHARCIRAAAETRTPVLIRDLTHPNGEGSRIGGAESPAAGVKTVTCRENMAVLLLQNLDARRQVGFLAGVFQVFSARGISVDLVATSETTTTVAIDCAGNHLDEADLQDLETALSPLCIVDRFSDCVCVNLVGRGVRTALARTGDVMRLFDERPLLMASQSANDLCLSLLVRKGDHEPLVQSAHAALIPPFRSGAGGNDGFGPTWSALRGAG
jgi:diaminopimelate decarboxylase/aspartate kinase